jgi:2-polyprenyl-6-methoxyphenol hydroxylase-like FAD-dependent oxidoreductase
MEDGAVLGLLLGHIESKDDLPKALNMYERLRKARGEAIVRETFKQVRQYIRKQTERTLTNGTETCFPHAKWS